MGNSTNGKDLSLVNFIFTPKVTWLPIGCLSLVQSLRKHGIQTDFRDLQLYRNRGIYNIEKYPAFFADSADIIAVSCYTHALPYLVKVLELVKRENPEKKIILGGIGPSIVARELLMNFNFIDVIVLNNEHKALRELVEAYRSENPDLSSIDNIAFMNDGELVVKMGAASDSELNRSLISELENVDLDYYHGFPVLLAKGCPYKCPFCSFPAYSSKYEIRDPAIAQEEIDYLNSRLPEKRVVYLLDEAFLADKKRSQAFLGFTGQNKFRDKMVFACDARVDYMNEEIITDLGDNNFSIVFYGIESGSDAIIKRLNKNYDINRALHIVKLTKQHVQTVFASFMFGFPFESFDEFKETLFQALHLSSHQVEIVFRLLCPLPKTPLIRKYGHTMRFSREITPQLCALKKPARNLEPVFEMAESYPDVFPTFYHYESPELERKYALAEKYRPEMENRHYYDYEKEYPDFKNKFID